MLLHVHGFHSYPARLHPGTADALIRGLSADGDRVFDPFCGSGTVPVVARERGRRAFGSDLNPLAVELARLKSGGASPDFAAALQAAAGRVVAHAKARQKAELGPTHPYGRADRNEFATHVLLALDGLRDGIEALEERALRGPLLLVLSASLTKLSNKTSDSGAGEQQKRLSRTFAFRFFELKAKDLADRLLAFSDRVPRGTPLARLEVSDARRLAFLRPASVDLITSSPPYPGVYDYFDHHASRLRWLRLDGRAFEDNEIGARRRLRTDARNAAARWESDFGHCLAEMRRVLRPGGHAALLVADSVIGDRAYYADQWVPALARQHSLELVGRASQIRPYFHGPTARAFVKRPRREHLLLLA